MINNVIVTAVIPARLKSTRLPEKMLLDIDGIQLIIRTVIAVEKCKQLSNIIVATDSVEIMSICEKYNKRAILTSEEALSGSDRVYEALINEDVKTDYVINIQGDEPLIDSQDIDNLIEFSLKEKAQISTMIKRIDREEDYLNINVVKAVIDNNNNALYFSRSPIPYVRDTSIETYLKNEKVFKHIGVYLYSLESLKRFVQTAKSKLEKAENLEQLRILESGEKIFCFEIFNETIGIDTLEDYNTVKKIFESQKNDLHN